MMGDPSPGLIERARRFGERRAILAPEGEFTYQDLLDASAEMAATLLDGCSDLHDSRVAFLVPPSFAYTAVQWGIWRAGGIAVPLCVTHPRPELEYVVGDAGADTVVVHPDFEALLRPVAEERRLRLLRVPEFPASSTVRGSQGSSSSSSSSSSSGADRGRREPPNSGADRGRGRGRGRTEPPNAERGAMILYTSGTTSKPKGVVTTHATIEAQVRSLVEAWEWTAEDRILNFLPLHHIHGIINVLGCALWVGAECRMLPRFDADEVWSRLIEDDLTLFMAVPTIYVRLIGAWEAAPAERRREMSAACRKLRLMVSGSAALPVPVLERWREISGHTLLERYGMTEIGMALSNPLHGARLSGRVGTPLPGVEVRLVDESHREVAPGTPGEIEVRGETVFLEYWNRPEATREAFRDGWFRTGDVAVLEGGAYRILGRSSIDIIKTGGYKVSALEIEDVLLAHPQVSECAVVGIEDAEWGERVCAAVVVNDGELSLEALRDWGRERLAPYKVPSRLLTLAALPRNAMGKVTKPELAALFRG